jgi:hypothetical protein
MVASPSRSGRRCAATCGPVLPLAVEDEAVLGQASDHSGSLPAVIAVRGTPRRSITGCVCHEHDWRF